MKKIRLLSTIYFIVLTSVSFAQDVIVTKDSKRIDAKVTEVNIDNVKYKSFDNQDGQVYTLLKSDIASIVYQNGQVDIFISENQKSKMPDQTESVSNKAMQVNETPITLSETILTDMKTYNPLMYSQYQSGKKLKTTGLILSCVGGAMAIVGFEMRSTGYDRYFERLLMVIGGGHIGAGVSSMIVGSSRKNRAIRNFSKYYYSLQQPASYFQLNLHPNNIGFAYVF